MEALLIHYRHIRIVGLASSEVIMTAVAAYLIAACLTNRQQDFTRNFFIVFIRLFGLAIVVHAYFGVHTELNYWLGISKCPPDFNSVSGIFDCPRENNTLDPLSLVANATRNLSSPFLGQNLHEEL